MKDTNIYSGSHDALCAALTNPTALAHRKGRIPHTYPVLFNGVTYTDAETAYKIFRSDTVDSNDALMTLIIKHKLEQYPELMQGIRDRGGLAWLRRCTHWTGTRRVNDWEGNGTESRFIRNLIAGYIEALIN